MTSEQKIEIRLEEIREIQKRLRNQGRDEEARNWNCAVHELESLIGR